MDGAVCLRETAFLFHHSICAGKSRCRRFWTSFLEKFFRFDEKNSCAYPSCMLYWWCIYHPGMTLTTRSRGVRETHRTERNGTAMKKRLLSILLVFVIVLSTLPIPAFAEDGGEAAPTCICETACTAEEMNIDCPGCGAEGAQPENCALYTKVPDMDDPAPEDEDDEAFEEDGTPEGGEASALAPQLAEGGAYPLLLRRQRQRGRSYQPPGRDLYGVHKGKLPSPDFQHRKSQRSLRLSGE